ncbi:40S ribosomal protein S15-3 [Cucumispora dikerogammari]|nr:40S ribosomal protein S15-3 [Cucumispora dikerogammari]
MESIVTTENTTDLNPSSTPNIKTSLKKKQTFKKVSFKGVLIENLLSLSLAEFALLLNAPLRRKLKRGLTSPEFELINLCKQAHINNKFYKESNPVFTQARDTPIVHYMLNNTIAIYNGCGYVPIEIKPDMLGQRLKHYVLSKNSKSHGKPGVGGLGSGKFVVKK